MADKDRILGYLAQFNTEPHSLAEIKTALPQVPDRTLRRWLAQLVAQGSVKRLGQLKGTRYLLAEPAPVESSSSIAPGEIFSPVNRSLLAQIDAPIYTRSPVTYSVDWVESYVPNESFYLSATQRALLAERGKRPALHGRAGTYIQKVFNRLLIDLSYNSARLEGNTYTLADTERLVMQGISAPGKLDEERIMILNHKEAIRYLVNNAATVALDEETIRTLHYLLADSLVASGMAGRIRDEGVRIGGTTYAPLEGRERLTLLLVELLAKARRIDDPFERSFFLLGHISYLQAFVDVNKRTARLASIIPLIGNDYVPQSFIDVDQSDYTKALLCFYELNETGPLAALYCWAYLRSCAHYDTTLEVVGFDEISALYRPQRRTLVAQMVRSGVTAVRASGYIDKHMPPQVAGEHREKFREDVLAELLHLDTAHMKGLGITPEQLREWTEKGKK